VDFNQLLEELSASRPYLYDALLITICAALFHLIALLARWLLKRGARLTPADQPSWARDLQVATRNVLVPTMTLAGGYIGFRFVVRHHPERYRFLAAELAAGFLYVAVLLLCVWLTIRFLRVWLGWYRVRLQSHGEIKHVEPITLSIERVAKVIIVAGAVIVALRHFHQDVSSLIVSLGIGSLAIGLAAQDTLSNMLSGFLILLDRPFTLGDRLQLSGGDSGEVIDIGIRSTRIRTGTGAIIIVANKELAQQRLTNLSPPEKRLRVTLEFSCPIESDGEKLAGAAQRACAPGPHLHSSPDPQLRLISIDGVRRYSLSAWAAKAGERGAAVDQIANRLLAELMAGGIEIVPSKRETVIETVRPAEAKIPPVE
jgi:small-conductance mechanosensitive channel